MTVGPPLDWQPVLSSVEVAILAKWALQIADTLGHEIQLMALARIGGRRGIEGCLPWHYTELHIPAYSESFLAVPRSAATRVIERPSDLVHFREKGPMHGIRGYLIRPAPGFLRDSSFLEETATLAREHDTPVYLEGSVLGHAYYIMSRAGAKVIPISREEPKDKRTPYGKLVRDGIPMIIADAGGVARVRTVSREEAGELLVRKLVEEALEAWACDSVSIVSELADVLEVADALRKHNGISEASLKAEREKKRQKRGAFERLVYLEDTTLRPLKSPNAEGGLFPLNGDIVAPPSRVHHASDSVMKEDPTSSPDEIVRFSCPLVPPMSTNASGHVLRLRISGLEITAEYQGQSIRVTVARPRHHVQSRQLFLFPELAEGEPCD